MAKVNHFDNSDDLVRHIKARADDIDAVWINMSNGVTVGSGKDLVNHVGIAGIVRYLDGSTSLIHWEDTEHILNDEGIRRLRIPFRLLLPGNALPELKG